MLERVAIVLVEPREAGNIGAAARALANAGLGRLILVRPAAYLVPEAFKMALAARPILERAQAFDELGTALANFGFVVGTTRRGGSGRRARITPRVLAAEISLQTARNEIAVLFGREESGLTNDELKFCHRLVTIPTSEGFPSLNLAQAVMVIGYELLVRSSGEESGPAASVLRRAPTEALEGLFTHMERVLLEIGYLHPDNPQRMMRVFRRILGRAGLGVREVRTLRGIFRQVEWSAGRRDER